jgi:hypothetical protein
VATFRHKTDFFAAKNSPENRASKIRYFDQNGYISIQQQHQNRRQVDSPHGHNRRRSARASTVAAFSATTARKFIRVSLFVILRNPLVQPELHGYYYFAKNADRRITCH